MYIDKHLFIFFMLFTIGQKMFIRFNMLAIHTKVKLIIILCKMKCIFYCGRGKSEQTPLVRRNTAKDLLSALGSQIKH